MLPLSQNISSYKIWPRNDSFFEDGLDSSIILDAVTNKSGNGSSGLESYVKDGHFIYRIAIPGIEKNDVNVSVVDDHVTIKGQRKAPAGIDQKSLYLNGFRYGPFELTFSLPENADSQEVTAAYNNGVLEISVVLCKVQQPRVIEVQQVGSKELKN